MVGGADDACADDGRGARSSPTGAWADGEPEPVDELRLLVGAEEQVDGRVALLQARPVGLADGAAGQDDPQGGIRGLQAVEVALPADDLLLGGLADRAGVDHDEVGGLERRRLLAARRPAAGPAISSESLRFIWQPSVQTWKLGSARVSGRYSSRRPSTACCVRRRCAAWAVRGRGPAGSGRQVE